MRFCVYGGLLLAALAVCAGMVLAVKKKKFALLYAAVAFLLMMILLWWNLPVTRVLQHTSDDQIEYVHMAAPGSGERPVLTDKEKAAVLAALRETGFSHGGSRSNGFDVEKDDYYHFTILTKDDRWIHVDVFMYADGGTAVSVRTDAPWTYHAGDPTPLVRTVEAVLRLREESPIG